MIEKLINVINNQDTVKMLSFLETFSSKQGRNKFGQKLCDAECGEIIQIIK